MKWHYTCPICSLEHSCGWKERNADHKCPESMFYYKVPGLQDPPRVYVDTLQWPEEIENRVVRIKGRKCTVPGCRRRYQILDHRIPWKKGGRTSVENLWPICETHYREKEDRDWDEWLDEEWGRLKNRQKNNIGEKSRHKV